MIEFLENNDDRADQITGGNDNNTLGISIANLDLNHLFITCSQYGHMFIIHFNSVQ